MEKRSIIFQLFTNSIKKIFELTSHLTFGDGVVLSIVVSLLLCYFFRRKKYKISTVSLNLPFLLGNITYEATSQDRVVAWKMYTQLKTRKAALIFDEDNDVIADIYASLYELFPISRDLLMNLPLGEIERSNGIADLVFRVQNIGIRPHLTKWQADFHKWWGNAIKDEHNKNKRPQDIQKDYPQYKDLIADLKSMNLELDKYAEDLLRIAKTRSTIEGFRKIKRPKPMQPSTQQ